MLPATAAICSYRLGGTDGVSVEAAKWQTALRELGVAVHSVAGSGYAQRIVPGLAIDAATGVGDDELEAAFDDAELVIVENLCSLPLNRTASLAVERALRGRRALLHHHDLALERPELAHLGPPPDHPAWTHVCISDAAVDLLACHGIPATRCYNAFEIDPPLVARETARLVAGLSDARRIIVQPTRAIARKNVPAGLALAEALGATYWLTGPAEDGYGPRLQAVLARARTTVVHRPVRDVATAYGAADLVVVPSVLEGFGNPAVEGALHQRLVAVGPYPMARELADLGFAFLDALDPAAVEEALHTSSDPVIEANVAAARRHLDLADLPRRLEEILRAPRPGPAGGSR